MTERYPALARLWPLGTLVFWYLCLGAALRLVLWAQFGFEQQVSRPSLMWIFPAGAVADGVQALYLLAPFALFLALLLNDLAIACYQTASEMFHERRYN